MNKKTFAIFQLLVKQRKKLYFTLKNHHIYTREPNLLKGKTNYSPDRIPVKNSPSKLMIYSETSIKITSTYALPVKIRQCME